jgi:hypothetical protein
MDEIAFLSIIFTGPVWVFFSDIFRPYFSDIKEGEIRGVYINLLKKVYRPKNDDGQL